VEFRAADFMAAATVTDADVRTYYDENRARFPVPPEKKAAGDKKPGQPTASAPDNPDADFAVVRPTVEQALKTERAMRLAARAAADLTVAIYEQKLKPHTPAFDEFFAKSQLTLKPAAPFHQENVPPDLGWTPQIVDQALQLTADRPVSDALPFAAGSFDAVTCSHAFYEIKGETQSSALEEIVRVLLEGIPEIRRKVNRDVLAAFRGDPAARSQEEVILSYPGVEAILIHRIAHELWIRDVAMIPRMMSEHIHGVTGIDIHPGAVIGDSFFIDHGTGVVVGETAVIGGLTVTDVTVAKSGIPFLVDLPLVGRLFGFRTSREERRDLLILVTPHIIDDLSTGAPSRP
jgi:hypothetical protein